MSFASSISPFALSAIIFVAGCGGGSGDGDAVTQAGPFASAGSGPITDSEAYAFEAEYFQVYQNWELGAVTDTLPQTTSARYDGYLFMDLTQSTYVGGRVSLTADFTANSVNGSATDFSVIGSPTDPILEDVAGTLSISSGTIAAPGYTFNSFSADLNGTLSTRSDSHKVDGRLGGSFFEHSGENYAAARVYGNQTGADNVTLSIDGNLVAKQK